MGLRQQVATVSAVLFTVAQSHAAAPTQADFDQAVGKITSDSVLLSRWMTDQMRYAVPFNSTSGDVVPRQLKLFGFEVGVEGVVSASKVDVNGFRTMPTQIVDTGKIDVKDRLPFPAVIAHAKIGLPFGFDAGVRAGGIPEKKFDSGDSKFKVKNNIVGFDLRKKLVDETALKPFGLTLGLNYTHAKGDIDVTTPYSGSGSQSGYTATLQNAQGTEHSQWTSHSAGVQAILNKKMFIFNPYIGGAANHNWGHVSNTLTNSGDVLLDDGAGHTMTQPFTTTGDSQQGLNPWDVRGLAGLELTIFPFMRLDLGGEYAGANKAAANVGLRLQFR